MVDVIEKILLLDFNDSIRKHVDKLAKDKFSLIRISYFLTRISLTFSIVLGIYYSTVVTIIPDSSRVYFISNIPSFWLNFIASMFGLYLGLTFVGYLHIQKLKKT